MAPAVKEESSSSMLRLPHANVQPLRKKLPTFPDPMATPCDCKEVRQLHAVAVLRRHHAPSPERLLLLLVVLLACAVFMGYTIVNTQHANVVRTLHTLLIWETTLSVRALRVSLAAVHLAAAGVLLSTVNLLWLGVLAGRLSGGRLVSDRRKLRTAHLWWHHVLLVLARLTLGLGGVLTGSRSLLALSLLFGLALIFFFLLLCLPFFANFFELYISQASQHMQGESK